MEWFYPALKHGETHLAVNKTTAGLVVDVLERRPTKAERLVEGAKRVQRELVSPDGIARYVRMVVDELRAFQAQATVLDDANATAALFAGLDCGAAARRFFFYPRSARRVVGVAAAPRVPRGDAAETGRGGCRAERQIAPSAERPRRPRRPWSVVAAAAPRPRTGPRVGTPSADRPRRLPRPNWPPRAGNEFVETTVLGMGRHPEHMHYVDDRREPIKDCATLVAAMLGAPGPEQTRRKPSGPKERLVSDRSVGKVVVK